VEPVLVMPGQYVSKWGVCSQEPASLPGPMIKNPR
jgi:hypothetical protein